MRAAVIPMRKPDDPRTRLTLHDEITKAQQALVDARGRLLEARTREQFEAVFKALRRASRHVDSASGQCISVLGRLRREESDEGEES